MSKGNRKREANAIKQQQRLEREKFEANKRRVRKVTATITTVLILGVVLAIIAGLIINNVRLNRGEYLRREIAASSENIDVDGAMMNYYFNDTYNNFLSYYGSYASYFGLNTSLSLKQQEVSDGETWFEYFIAGAKSTVTNLLTLNEAARAEGVSLSEDEIAAVNARANNTNKAYYGRGTSNTDIYNAKLLEALAYKYQSMKETELTPSNEEIDARYAENSKNYQFVDYLAFPLYYVSPDEDSTPGREQSVIITEDDVKEFSDKLSSAASADDFKAAVREVLLAENPNMADEDIETELASLELTNEVYEKDNEALEWAFTANVGDTYVVTDTENKTYTVYMLTAAAYLDEAQTINVRHILLSDSTYGNREKAVAKAEELLAEFEAGGKLIEDFAVLALEYSEDPGSCYNGGIYLNVAEGYMVESFNDWCFDTARKAGDTGIVESDYGVHVMYFDGDGGEAWRASVSSDILAERIDELNTEWREAYPVLFDDTVLDTIPG